MRDGDQNCILIAQPIRSNVWCQENIHGKENGEAAGLDERGHSYTQDPRAQEDKDHGNRAPIEAKRGSAVYSGI